MIALTENSESSARTWPRKNPPAVRVVAQKLSMEACILVHLLAEDDAGQCDRIRKLRRGVYEQVLDLLASKAFF